MPAKDDNGPNDPLADLRNREVIKGLADNEPLEPHLRAHQLAGGLARLWKCRIEGGWRLVWDEDNTSVTPMRTGTHSGIFS